MLRWPEIIILFSLSCHEHYRLYIPLSVLAVLAHANLQDVP